MVKSMGLSSLSTTNLRATWKGQEEEEEEDEVVSSHDRSLVACEWTMPEDSANGGRVRGSRARSFKTRIDRV